MLSYTLISRKAKRRLMTQVSKTLLYGHRMAFTIAYSFQIISTVFVSCQSDSHGGAVYLNNQLLNCTIMFCSFDSCITTASNGHGGGIAVQQSFKTVISYSCFMKCRGYRCPGALIWGISNAPNQYCMEAHNNMTSECNPDTSGGGSSYYSLGLLFYYNNNVTKSITNDISAGFYFGVNSNSICGRYITVSLSQGPGLFGHAIYNNGIRNIIEYANFISSYVSPTGGLVHLHIMSNTVVLKNSAFSNCSFANAVKRRDSTGTVEFVDCSFDSNSAGSSFIHASTINCVFSSNPTLNIHKVLETNICWVDNMQLNPPYTKIVVFYRHIFLTIFSQFITM